MQDPNQIVLTKNKCGVLCRAQILKIPEMKSPEENPIVSVIFHGMLEF